ncbi:hypothetical protein FB451DRAFT_1409488 [Mycena latifolia]|nr:hypothetical protein FB451DRAFT_1409488 [Mycena latifolia]
MLKPKSSVKYVPADAILGATSNASNPVTALAVLPARGRPALRAAHGVRTAARRVARTAFLRYVAQDALEHAWREGVWRGTDHRFVYQSSAHPEYHPDRLARARLPRRRARRAGAHLRGHARADVCCYTPDDVRPGPACACLPPGSSPRDFGTVGSSAVPCAPARTSTLLFPNEVYDREPGGRPALWAGGAQNSRTEARHETHALQEALGAHGCNLHTAVAAHMTITKMLRRWHCASPPFSARPRRGEPPEPAVQPPAGDRKSGVRVRFIYYFNELVIRRVTLSVQYRFLSDPIREDAAQAAPVCGPAADDARIFFPAVRCVTFRVPREVMHALWPYPPLHKRLAACEQRVRTSRRRARAS